MFDGSIKKIEDIQIGEQVMGDDNTARNVLELCHNYDKMFNIIKKNGESYTVNKQHKLVLCCKKNIITEITVENYLLQSTSWKNKNKLYRSCGVNFPDKGENLNYYIEGYTINFHSEINDNCKINSIQNRLEFLAGIIDSNGLYDGNTITLLIPSSPLGSSPLDSSANLTCCDIIYLTRSLGYTCNKKIVKKTCKKLNIELSYFLISIYGFLQDIPCKIIKINTTLGSVYKHLHDSFKVEPNSDCVEYYGFMLDQNHRFLLASFDVVRNTGKTTLISSILYEKKHIFPVGIVMSGTEDSNGFYRKLFPSTFVYNKYEEDRITSFIRRQKISKQHLTNPWAVILLDDCTDDPSLFKKPLQASMYKNGRHWKMLYILSLQYCMDVKPAIRTNVDGTFILREPNLKNRRSLYENYAGIIPDFTLFCEILDALTDDFTALYIHNSSTSNNWKDCIFYYKARIIPQDFKFGCPEFWQFHEARYNSDYVDNVI